ncbi:phospholipid carrier-dependent glycosyltransferase [Nocardioides sp. AE5]|uniref:dolichyl-phosphate-mannose--protein mannosyltransferase n=1 Tax=Nocardioides sp. AE5 TaxID=2962573 RepID=UPI0028829BFE|nr:phospholipid carrier-dependent glycosyltransferase [Nocardioides sp. AE5]MDT0203759.1 phospholipid carrier-dependent glycosyltransferase [Nocardioides sp. AE5]
MTPRPDPRLAVLRRESRLVGWGAALAVGALAFFLRVWKLGRPHEFSFDETYYAKDAWSLLQHGYVVRYVEDANDKIIGGQLDGLWDTDRPSMIVHPEVGKWMIAVGEHFFGMDPFGWRISAAVVGALMCVIMVRLVRRLTGSTMFGVVGGLMLCLDGMHLVLSRLGLLDIFLAFWLLAAVAALVVDRDWTRERLLVRLADRDPGDARDLVRRLWFRPWRLTAGICFGLAIGTKWSGLYALAAFGILAWAWEMGARRAIGARIPMMRSAIVDGIPAFVHLVVVAGLVYTASWTGWLIHAEKYEEAFSASQYARFVSMDANCNATTDDRLQWSTATEPDASGFGEFTQSLRSLIHYHHDVYTFHTNFLNCSEHTYQSQPEGWLLINRPVGVNVENDIAPGEQGCTAAADSTCLRQVLLIGTPILWWGGALALIYAGFAWVGRRDWRFGIPVVGALAMWLPWEFSDLRPIFSFYASAILPFTVVALCLVMGHILGPDRGPTLRRTVGTIVCGSFVVLVLLNFAWFWPIWTNELLTRSEWLDRMWFSRWI